MVGPIFSNFQSCRSLKFWYVQHYYFCNNYSGFLSSTYLGVSKVVDASTKSEKHEHEDFSDFPKVKPKTYGMKQSNSTELLCDLISKIENRSDAPRPSPRHQIYISDFRGFSWGSQPRLFNQSHLFILQYNLKRPFWPSLIDHFKRKRDQRIFIGNKEQWFLGKSVESPNLGSGGGLGGHFYFKF